MADENDIDEAFDEALEEELQNPEEDETEEDKDESSFLGNIPWTVVAVVAGLLVAGWFFLQNRNNQSQTQPEPSSEEEAVEGAGSQGTNLIER